MHFSMLREVFLLLPPQYAPLRRLCSSTASERCFASADFLLTVLADVYKHGGRRGRALHAPQVNSGGAGGFGGASLVCVMRVAARSGSVCWVPARMLLAVRMRSCAPE